jgi:hypothetical protein
VRFLSGAVKPARYPLLHLGSPGNARSAATSAAVFVLMAAGLLAGSAPAAASDVLGGIDMQRACNTQYYDAFHFRAVVLDEHDAYSWRCVKDWDTTNGIDFDGACLIQYGAGARAGLTFWWNPYSWYCLR